MATITTAGSGDWDAGATWTGGSVPADGDTASIESGHTCTLTENEQVGAVVINSGTIAGGGFKITCVKTSGRLFDHSGTITGNLDVELQGTHSTTEDFMGTGTINHLTLNGSGLNVDIGRDTTLGNLTITQGTLNTNGTHNHALTVTGNTVVTGTLTGNNSTLIFGTSGVHGPTESGALHVESSGSLTFGSGDLTAFSGFTAKGTNTVTSTGGGDIKIKGRTNNGFMNSHGHTGVNITGDYIIDFDDNGLHDVRNNMAITAANINYPHGGRTYKFWTTATDSTVTFTGNFNVSNGTATVNTQDSGREATDVFTVTGDTTLTGDLIANDTTINFGSLTIGSNGEYSATSGTTTILGSSGGFALLDEGTFTHNSGTVKIDFETSNLNSSTRIHQNGAKKLNNVEIEMNRTTDEVTWSVASGTSQGIAGNLTLTKGESYLYSLAHDFDVDGNFLVDANGTWGSLGHTGAHEAGSLTINSGGTYMATSGTTTITTATGAGSSSNRAFFCHNAGVFTHNKGLLKTTASSADLEFTSQSETNNPMYDFEATQYAIAAANEWTVMNNMTIANGFQFNGGAGRAKVYGIMKQTGGTYNASDVSSSTDHFFNHYRLEGGTLDLSNIDITVGSIRNTGGTIT